MSLLAFPIHLNTYVMSLRPLEHNNMFTLTVRGSSESDFCRRQVLPTKVDSRTVRVKDRECAVMHIIMYSY